MSIDDIKAAASGVYALADECQVPMLRACRNIGMANTTPYRWLRNGSAPGPGQLEGLRASILRIAAHRGTLPDRHRAEFDALGDEPVKQHRPLGDIARDLKRTMAELERAIPAGEGGGL